MTNKTDTPTERPRRDRLPRNRQRERVLQILRERDGAIDAGEVAAQIGLHVTTARFHLDALCDEGFIVRTRMKLAGAGRPRTGYVAVEERLDYRILAEVLAMELGQTVETRARRAQRAGQKWAARLTASNDAQTNAVGAPSEGSNDSLDRAALRATEVFTRMGFDPELAPSVAADGDSSATRERLIHLHACPVRELARLHPEVGCGVHLGLLQGLLTDPDGPAGSRQAISGHLEPLVEPEMCVARLVTG